METVNKTFTDMDIAFLQAYLIELFKHENKCEENLKHTEWYLGEKFSIEVKEDILDYLQENNVNCDCDLIKKINSYTE